MGQVLIQIVADDQGAVRLEYMADLVRLLPPRGDRPAAGPLCNRAGQGRPGIAGWPPGRQAAAVGQPAAASAEALTEGGHFSRYQPRFTFAAKG